MYIEITLRAIYLFCPLFEFADFPRIVRGKLSVYMESAAEYL